MDLIDVREPVRAARRLHRRLAPPAAGGAVQPPAGVLYCERPLVFQCRVGARSGMAAHAFRRAGYDAYNLRGGIAAWAERGLPLEPMGGFVADH